MADLLVKTSDQPGPRSWRDNDLLVAISDHRRRCRLARVAWRDNSPTGPPVLQRHAQGEYLGNGLHEEIHKTFRRVSVRVVSATEIEVTYPGETPFVVGPTPITHPITGRPTHIHLSEFLAARRQSGKLLFRDPVTDEIRWYTRETPLPSRSAVKSLWQKLGFGHGWQAGGHFCPELWPFGIEERRVHLPLYVEDWRDTQETTWVNPRTALRSRKLLDAEDSPRTLRQAEYRVDWRALPGMSATHQRDVLDTAQVFDRRRDATPFATAIIERKD